MHLAITHSTTTFNRGTPGFFTYVAIKDANGRELAAYSGPGTDIDSPRWVPSIIDLGLAGRECQHSRSGNTATITYAGHVPLTALHPTVRADVADAWIRARRLPRVRSYCARESAWRTSDVRRLYDLLRPGSRSAREDLYRARHLDRLAARVARARVDLPLEERHAARDAETAIRLSGDVAEARRVARGVPAVAALLG
jgi:hypothetical protein